RNAKQGRQVEKNRLGNEDGANGLIVQRLLKRPSGRFFYSRQKRRREGVTQSVTNFMPTRSTGTTPIVPHAPAWECRSGRSASDLEYLIVSVKAYFIFIE
ncbi:hypothetical protein, partial [Pseudomonas syringae]|uniref:hypothetical protein n=1 Tax=Pseudomonas syringae TaxID=317 RepID=UPI001FF8D218